MNSFFCIPLPGKHRISLFLDVIPLVGMKWLSTPAACDDAAHKDNGLLTIASGLGMRGARIVGRASEGTDSLGSGIGMRIRCQIRKRASELVVVVVNPLLFIALYRSEWLHASSLPSPRPALFSSVWSRDSYPLGCNCPDREVEIRTFSRVGRPTCFTSGPGGILSTDGRIMCGH